MVLETNKIAGELIVMSLELFSSLSEVIPDDVFKEVVLCLEHEYHYRNVYVSENGGYGFIYKNKVYNEKEPPLFEIFISNTLVVLSVFGDLNEQSVIEKGVSYAFNKSGIFVDFIEE